MSTESIIDNDTGLEIPQAAKDSIAKLNTVEAGVAAMLKKYAAAPDASTPEGYELAKSEAKEIAAVRISADKAHKIAKAPYWEGGKRIDAMKKSIVDRISPLEDVRKDAIKAVDDEKERIEQEAAEKEQARIEGIERGMQIISNQLQSVTLETVSLSIDMLADTSYEDFDEFEEQARSKVDEVVATLTERKAVLQAQADEAAKLEAQRKEQEAADAKARAEREQFEREKREFAEQQEAEKRRRADAEAEEKRKKEQAAREKAAAEQAEKDKAAALEAAEQQRLADIETARQQAIADEQARVEAEKAKAEADQVEADRLAAEAPDKEKMLAWLDSIGEVPSMKTKPFKDAAMNFASIVDQMRIDAKLIGSRRKKAA